MIKSESEVDVEFGFALDAACYKKSLMYKYQKLLRSYILT
jgi:hypothetical protein